MTTAGVLSTLDDMAGKRKTSGPKKPNRTSVPLHINIDPELRKAIDALSEENRRSLTLEVTIALEERLAKFGKWPPAKQ